MNARLLLPLTASALVSWIIGPTASASDGGHAATAPSSLDHDSPEGCGGDIIGSLLAATGIIVAGAAIAERMPNAGCGDGDACMSSEVIVLPRTWALVAPWLVPAATAIGGHLSNLKGSFGASLGGSLGGSLVGFTLSVALWKADHEILPMITGVLGPVVGSIVGYRLSLDGEDPTDNSKRVAWFVLPDGRGGGATGLALSF